MHSLIRNARQIITCKSDGLPKSGRFQSDINVIDYGSLLVSGEKIEYVGSNAQVEQFIEKNGLEDIREIDATGKIVMPGFVDSHTHFVFAGSRENEYEMRLSGRSYQEIAESGGGIWSTVSNVRSSRTADLKSSCVKILEKFFSCGTTTLEGKSGYGLDTENEIKMLNVLNELNSYNEFGMDVIPTFLGAHSVPREMDKQSYVELICNEMIPLVAENHLSGFIDIFIEKGYFDTKDADKILGCGVDAGLVPRTHIDQFNSMNGTEVCLKHGAASLDHLEVLTENDIEKISAHNEKADRKTIAGLLPGVSYFLGIKYAPARALIEANVPVLIATDFNPGSCMSENMQMMMSLASTQMKMTAEEIINAVTINPAYSLGLNHTLGSLEQGKQADLLVFDIPSYKYLIYNFGVNNLEYIMKKGKIFRTGFLNPVFEN